MENLTNAQKSVWVTEQYYKGSSVNNICGTAIIEEKVDFKKLEQAIELVCKKHANFKLQMKLKDGNIIQELSDKVDCKIEFIDVCNLEELEQIRKKIVRKPFNIENSYLFKFYIFKFTNGQGAFMLNIHHLISDAWTLAFICNEIIKTYSALKQNKKIEKQVQYSYMDFINSEKEYIKSEKFQKDRAYWIEQFKTIPEVAIIPGSKERNPKEINAEGNRILYQIDKEFVDKIKNYCKENKISLYNFFMAVFGIYISEITNLDEFVIGTPILNRTNYKEKNAAGMFINMEPFKINLKDVEDFKTFVKNLAINSLNMMKHQKYSYQNLLEELREKDKNIPNLYNILLSYQITNAQTTEENIKYKTEWTFNGCCADDMDIQIYDLDDTGNLNISYDYKVSLYTEKDIEGIHRRIIYMIKQIISEENIKINNIEIVTPEEREKLVVEFNKTILEYNKNIPIVKYFEQQVERTPDNIAIVFEKRTMTYKELNEKSNSLAYYLREKGVKNNTIVGIMVNRSFEMMISILAVLKSGGCYIPIAPDYPDERIEYMLNDSDAEILLTTTKQINRIKLDQKIINVELNNNDIYDKNKQNIENISKPEDLSYMIYTSGSTGIPKGVMLKQKNLSNFYNAMKESIDYLKDGKQHKIISITTVSFDIFIFETIMSLTRGLILYMTNENEQKSTVELEKIIKENQIEILQTTPSVMKTHLENQTDIASFKSLKYIILAGEPLSEKLVNDLKNRIPNIDIYNGYGPSETTIFSTIRNVTNLKKVTIGKPISNTQIYILNKNKKLLPQGLIGEIYISGDGVGKGYMNKKEQTENSYLKNPFKNNQIMYKTGDLGAFDNLGEISCLGRVDNQIKIRGLRIELSEIENQMLSIYNIADCVVIKKQVNERETLCAYYTQNGPVDENTIKAILRNKLPQYMVPQYFINMKAMPHTPNGKIDKKALPIPTIKEKNHKEIKPSNEMEKELVKIVKKILHIENVSMSDTLLDLGGDSLTAITLSTKILSKFNVQIYIKDILSNNTLKDIANCIIEKQQENNHIIKIKKASKQELYPLSSAQKRIYYNAKMIGEDNVVYNMPGGILVEEKLDKEKVKRVFEKIIERHEILRTSFVIKNAEVMQKIEDKINFEIPVYENTEKEINQIAKDFSRPFVLEKAPLIRVEMHYIDDKKTLVLVDAHHIIMDGTALNNLIIEFNRLYNEENLKKLPIQYKDYAIWENEYNKSEQIKEYETYWINKFKNSDFSQLNLPYDYKMPINRSYSGDKISKKIDEKEFRKIERFARKLGVSPYVFFISAFFVLLYKYTGQNEIILGSPIANRDINETKRLIGMFVNNIVIDGKIDSEKTFRQFLEEIKEQVLNDLSHQPYPFDMLVKKLKIQVDNSKNPLFDILFTYQNKEEKIVKTGNLNSEIVEINHNIAKFNLSLEIKPGTHTINIEYRTDLFRKQTIERLYEHYMNTLISVMSDKDIKIKDISIISEEEKNKILYEFNDTKLDYPKDKTIVQLFEEQVVRTPNSVAVIFENEKLTYNELNEKSNQLAHYLRNLGVKPNQIIGIMLPRSLELLITIIGVLKSGACYIPIDPTYPEKRIDYMLENSQANLLLTTNELYNTINFKNKINVELSNKEIYLNDTNNIENINSLEDTAYIIYTSGSTGTPKGVVLKHKSLANLCAYLNKNVEFLQRKCKYKNIASITTVSFDIFIFETLICLQRGLEIVLANEDEQRIPVLLDKLISNNDVQIIQMTPSRMQIFLDNINEMPNLQKLKYVVLAGEALPIRLRNSLKKLGVKKIYNGYGPSETTVFSTFTDVTDESTISIGKPLANTQTYILDSNLKVLPIGLAGELYISGDGVGKGYLNKPDITKERYIKNPFVDNSIMYKTGDICKYNECGNIYYLGREDNQVKIRGLRIELEEIENKILDNPFIKKVKVIKQTIEKREVIIAYYVAKKRIVQSELRKHLYETLPKYMVPSYFIPLDEFTYTPNGKIDKKALPIPNGILMNQKNNFVPAKTELEIKLVSIWEEILNTKPIGIKDNFFELGGDSILAMNLNIKLMKITDKIKYSDIFAYPTISEMAEKIQKDIENKNQNEITDLKHKYKDILLKNKNIPENVTYHNLKNVLLTGVTGFLGMHIMQKFLENENGKIYVIIRKEPGFTVKEKLLDKMHYYFDEKYDKYIDNRIIIIEGDIEKSGFGLSQNQIFDLGNSIDSIINSAAKVSHYGKYKDFYNVNVKGVENILEFANIFNIKVYHISTLSVSGNALVDQYYMEQKIEKETKFTEKDFYIGQNLENVYIKSKFEAEKRILDGILNGNNAYILRIGNLMPRISDGKFQENVSENAYLNRLKSFMEINVIPDYLKKTYLEFTPIDATAEAIIKIMQYSNNENRIYHVFNHNHVKMDDLLKILEELDMHIKVISDDEFKSIIKKDIVNSNTKSIKSIINDLDKDLKLNYDSKIKIDSKITIELLSKYGFVWPKIDKKYILNILKLIKGEEK